MLAKVGSTEGISQQELADALLVTKGNVCQLLDKMEGSGDRADCESWECEREAPQAARRLSL